MALRDWFSGGKKKEQKKYELVKDQTIEVDGRALYRIRALKDFGNVRKGDLGGFVESERNLSQEGECWIFDDATVFDRAQVKDDALVFDHAIVRDSAGIFGSALVFGEVFGDARVIGDALVGETARVGGRKRVTGPVAQPPGPGCLP